MEKIYFITGNKSKFEEAEQILSDANITLTLKNLKLDEIKEIEQKKVVVEKARQAFAQMKKPVLVDDTAIYFSSYKNFPGTYTKFLFQAIGFDGIRKILEGKSKNAHFKTMICYKDSANEKIFSGIWNGKIASKRGGKFNPNWEYNCIFIPSGCKNALSEISMEERAKKSHRRKAFNALIRYLRRKK
ncbi:MAG: non-canonical purine NTP pyrophosphatase [Candidatus Methylomirabilota bacterium]